MFEFIDFILQLHLTQNLFSYRCDDISWIVSENFSENSIVSKINLGLRSVIPGINWQVAQLEKQSRRSQRNVARIFHFYT